MTIPTSTRSPATTCSHAEPQLPAPAWRGAQASNAAGLQSASRPPPTCRATLQAMRVPGLHHLQRPPARAAATPLQHAHPPPAARHQCLCAAATLSRTQPRGLPPHWSHPPLSHSRHLSHCTIAPTPAANTDAPPHTTGRLAHARVKPRPAAGAHARCVPQRPPAHHMHPWKSSVRAT
jgi:hypothetical protein